MSEHSQVNLRDDLPTKGLLAGDVGTVVSILRGGQAYTVEFMTIAGRTIAVATVSSSQVAPLSGDAMPRARELTAV